MLKIDRHVLIMNMVDTTSYANIIHLRQLGTVTNNGSDHTAGGRQRAFLI